MNKVRRKKLWEAYELLGQAMSMIDEVKDDEESAFDNMPENLKESERGEAMQEYISSLEDISSTIEDQQNEIENIVSR